MSRGRRALVGPSTLLIMVLLLEVNSPADRLLQRMASRVSNVAWTALERLLL